MTKVIQVSDAIYKTLMLHKGMIMVKTKAPVTFDDAIAQEFNQANHLKQIISRLVRQFPEERDRIAGIAKELDHYDDVKSIVEHLPKIEK